MKGLYAGIQVLKFTNMIYLRTLVARILIVVIAVLSVDFSIHAAVITSTVTGGDWHDPASWAGGIVPGAGDNVVITSTAEITVSADAEASSLIVSGIIILNDGVTLTISGNVTIETEGELFLSGNTNCTGDSMSVLIVYGNYSNYGYSCFWKSWVVIAGDLYSPSASGIQSNGFLVIGGNAVGVIDQTGGNSVYPINPGAIISLTGTTPITTAPASPAELVEIIETVIFGGGFCGFTIEGPINDTTCISSSAHFVISSTTAASPSYQWEENRGTGWITLANSGVYSGVTTSNLSISNASGMDGYLYRCKITNGSLCGKYSFSATLTVLEISPVGPVGNITGTGSVCRGTEGVTYFIPEITNATGYIWSLPSGATITGGANTNNITVSFTASAISGNITVCGTNLCGNGAISTPFHVTIIPENTIILTSASGTNNQTGCINTAIVNITYSTTGATGATVTGLPAGVTGSWAADEVTISGTPTVSGTFHYTVNLTGGCGYVTTGGTITVTPENIIMLISGAGTSNQTVCISTEIMSITYSAIGATGASVTGLPTGVTSIWDEDVVLIEGKPTVTGTYNYTITLTGGCGTVTASGNITVNAANTITLSSAEGTNIQSRCINTPITDIIYSTTGATGASVTGLPPGVTGNWADNVFTISGTPTESGIFNYIVGLTGGCGAFTANGTITVVQLKTVSVSISADQNPLCAGNTVTLTAYPVNGGLTPSFQWKVNGLNVGINSNSYSYIPVNNDVITVALTSNESCLTGNPAVSFPLSINVDPIPSAPVILNITQPTCNTQTGSVVLGNLPSGNWTINPINIKGNTPSVVVSGLVPGTYTYTVTSTAGCTSPPSSEIVIREHVTTLSCSVSSQSDVLCNGGNTGSITVIASGGQEPYRYKLDSGAYQSSGFFNSLRSGTYVITVQDANLCTSTVQAVIPEPEKLSVTYSVKNTSSPASSDGTINLNIDGGKEPYNVLWSDGISTADRTNVATGDFTVRITDANGCEAYLEIAVVSESSEFGLEIQEIITPNGDGFYDTWKIKNIEMYPDAEIKVYNRWGKLVFGTRNIPGNEWDGTLDGHPLPTDSYRYVLYLDKDHAPVTGTVTIIR